MKLSEAVLKGETVLPAAFRLWLIKDAEGNFCAGCAVGRTCVAAGYQGKEFADSLSSFMDVKWPWTKNFKSGVRTLGVYNPIMEEMSMRYEDERQSMEEIAAWIADIEPTQE